MNRREGRSRRRGLVGSVELLDDRLVLSVVVALPSTPAPTASPFGVAHIGKFEHDLKRVDRGLNIHGKHSRSNVTNRVAYIQSAIARAASRANVPVQQVTVTSNARSSSAVTSRGRCTEQSSRPIGRRLQFQFVHKVHIRIRSSSECHRE